MNGNLASAKTKQRAQFLFNIIGSFGWHKFADLCTGCIPLNSDCKLHFSRSTIYFDII